MMSGGGDPVFIDTNVLVYAAISSSETHLAARNAISRYEQDGIVMWLSRQILREYLATLSRSQVYSNPVPATTLVNDIALFERRFQIAEDGPQVTKQLLDLISRIPVGGKNIHDANIVATM
jgi:predicted nucleic acid-binding protein